MYRTAGPARARDEMAARDGCRGDRRRRAEAVAERASLAAAVLTSMTTKFAEIYGLFLDKLCFEERNCFGDGLGLGKGFKKRRETRMKTVETGRKFCSVPAELFN